MKIGKALTAAVLALTVAGCALLPTAAARLLDRRESGDIGSVSITPVTFAQATGLSATEKLRRLTEGEYDDSCEVSTGINYTAATIRTNVRDQLSALDAAGLLPISPTGSETISVVTILYVISGSDPSSNLLLWLVSAKGADCSYSLLLDDDSGLALGLEFECGENSGVDARIQPADLARTYAAYLGSAMLEDYDTLTAQSKENEVSFYETYGYVDSGDYQLAIKKGLISTYDEQNWWDTVVFTLHDGDSTVALSAAGWYGGGRVGFCDF